MTSWHEGGAGDARVVTVHVPLGLGAYEAKVSDLLRRPTCPAPSSVEEDEGRARVLHWLTAWLHYECSTVLYIQSTTLTIQQLP